jgi:hypothetical protein
MLGFIFCEIFSNLVATGCRRGRTPERPLRQPPKVWLVKPGLSSCEGRPPRTGAMCLGKWVNRPCSVGRVGFLGFRPGGGLTVPHRGAGLRDVDDAVQELCARRSQIGIARCCVLGMIAPTVESGSFPFRYQTSGSGMPGGRTQEALDVSAEIARPFAELRWMGALPGTSRAKRRWRNQRISLTSGEESPGGSAHSGGSFAPRERRA